MGVSVDSSQQDQVSVKLKPALTVELVVVRFESLKLRLISNALAYNHVSMLVPQEEIAEEEEIYADYIEYVHRAFIAGLLTLF